MNAEEELRTIPETHCRILGNMQWPEGKSYLVVEIITATTPEQTASERDEVVIAYASTLHPTARAAARGPSGMAFAARALVYVGTPENSIR